MDIVGERYLKLYSSKPDFRAPKQYIHVQREYSATMFVIDDVGYSCFWVNWVTAPSSYGPPQLRFIIAKVHMWQWAGNKIIYKN